MLQQTNFDILTNGRLRTQSGDERMIDSYLEKGYDDRTRDGLKYLASKFALLETVSDSMGVSEKTKRSSYIEDERQLFIESKILMEQLKEHAASNLEQIAIAQERVNVG